MHDAIIFYLKLEVAIVLNNYTIHNDELFIKWMVNPGLCHPPNHYLIRHNVSTNSLELIINTTNVTLLGVLPGEIYYVEISLINGKQSSTFYIKG